MIQFSIVTISFNAAESLRRTVESVNEQTHPWIEHVIVDGGSEDGSAGIIENIARRNVRWISESDDGIADAFNKGTAIAKGDFVCYLNAGDTFLSENVLARVARSMALDTSERPTVYFGDFVSVIHNLERLHQTSAAPKAFAWRNPLNHQSAFIPHSVAMSNPYDTRLVLGMDYDFWLRVTPQVEFRKLAYPIAKFALDGRSSHPAWAVHNLAVRRMLWHVNRRKRIDLSDLLLLVVKAAALKGRLALRRLLGTRVSGCIRRFKGIGNSVEAKTSTEVLEKSID